MRWELWAGLAAVGVLGAVVVSDALAAEVTQVCLVPKNADGYWLSITSPDGAVSTTAGSADAALVAAARQDARERGVTMDHYCTSTAAGVIEMARPILRQRMIPYTARRP